MVFGYYAAAIGRAFFPSGNAYLSLMLSLMHFWRRLSDAPAGRRRARRLRRPARSACRPASDAEPDVHRHPVDRAVRRVTRRSACSRRCSCSPAACCRVFRPAWSSGVCRSTWPRSRPPGRKGFYVSWQSASQQVAVMFAAAIGVLLTRRLSPEAMTQWGWRVPLLLGCLIIPLLFQLRRSLPETEEFTARRHHPRTAEILGSLRRQWRVVLRRDAAGGHDDGVLLHDHGLYAHLRQLGAAPVFARQPAGDAVCGGVESPVAARYGGARPTGLVANLCCSAARSRCW